MAGQAFRWTNLALAFLLESCALVALGYWGVRPGNGPLARAVLGLAAPLAPVASPLLKPGTQLAVFGSTTLALYSTGHSLLAPSSTASSSASNDGAGDQDGRRADGRRQTSRKIFSDAAMGSSSRP